MAKEELKSSGDVDSIRKILFGDQISQVEERFNQDETAIAQLRSENRNLRQALEAEITARENASREINELFAAFQKEHEKTWHQSISNQEELISALENAIAKYKSDLTALPK